MLNPSFHAILNGH